MTLKIKCTYVAEGEPFTLGWEYDIYCADGGEFYIKTNEGIKARYFSDGSTSPLEGLLYELNEMWHSHFTTCATLEKEQEPEKDIKKEVHSLLDKLVDLVYNNQEVFNIKLNDFVTLVKLKEETK